MQHGRGHRPPLAWDLARLAAGVLPLGLWRWWRRRHGSGRLRPLDEMPAAELAVTRFLLAGLNAGGRFATTTLAAIGSHHPSAAGRASSPSSLLFHLLRLGGRRLRCDGGRCYAARFEFHLGACMPAHGRHALVVAVDPVRGRVAVRSRRLA